MRMILVAAALAAAGSAAADEETRLGGYGLWEVAHVAFDDGSTACKMESGERMRDGRVANSIGFYAFNTGATGALFWNDDWQASPRTVRVMIDVDYDRWNARADVEGSGLTVVGLQADFLRAVANGRAIALFAADGTRLMTYSLKGTGAAMGKLVECWTMISQRSDPFGAGVVSDDPF